MMAPVEPTAQVRRAANQLRQLYVALVDQGFTAHEALMLIGHALAAQTQGGAS